MNKTISAIVGIIVIVGAAFAVQTYQDARYMLKEDHRGFGWLPVGTIVAWHPQSESDAVPEGWATCDGTNGTPDLRGRFLAGDHPELHSTGGGELSDELDIQVIGTGWVNHDFKQHPVGGPEKGAPWLSQRWHPLVSKGTIPRIDLVPPYHEVIFIMRVE
ncbi:MAG: tail fiber protein [Boseongicola sp. SB0667_bin_21]|nr:tail fiber protein [Boseongicola sp. SB0667_bin_21]